MLVHTDVMLTQIGSRNKRLCDAGRLRSARCRALHGRLCVFLGAAYMMHFLSSVLLLVLNSSLSWDRQGDRLWGCFLSVRKWLFSNTDLEDHAPRCLLLSLFNTFPVVTYRSHRIWVLHFCLFSITQAASNPVALYIYAKLDSLKNPGTQRTSNPFSHVPHFMYKFESIWTHFQRQINCILE